MRPLVSWPVRYSFAIVSIAVASVITFFLEKVNAPTSVVIFTYLIAIMSTAWLAGYGPGILATLTGGVLGPYMMNPNLTVARLEVGRLALILVISLLISMVADHRAKAEAALRSMNRDLDQRVRERTEELRQVNAALRESEASLLRQAEELQRSNTELGHFAYVASHDMQEPLRMIGIFADLLRRRYTGKLDAEGDHYLRVVVESTGRLQRLVSDLLDYSRLLNRPPDELRTAELNDILRISMENLSAAIEETGASISIGTLPAIHCDAAQMTQLFQNLLSNALKYRRSHQPPQISVCAERGPSEWIVTVRDNGIGIKSEYLQRVFEPFKRLHGSEIPGSGIGLAICKQIVDRHGGRIWVESEDGEGAAFKFSIPVIV